MKLYMKKISLMIGVFAALLTAPSAFAGQINGEPQETICHYPQGNEINMQTIDVGEPSVLNAHLHHQNDHYGICPVICLSGATSCVSADGTPGIVIGSYTGPGMSGGAPGMPGAADDVYISRPSSLRNLKGS